MTVTIYRGDNTEAFGSKFLLIDIENPNALVISKAEFRCGDVLKEFLNPIFPIEVSLNEKETETLQRTNYGYLAVYDEKGRKKTLEGSVSFNAKGKVV